MPDLDFACECTWGFSGPVCTEFDPCSLVPCKNNASCHWNVTSPLNYTCACADEYHGVNCSYINQCVKYRPCQNGAQCTVDGTGVYSCQCSERWSGHNCSEFVLPCDRPSTSCGHGRCDNEAPTSDVYKCICALGWTGNYCNESKYLRESSTWKDIIAF